MPEWVDWDAAARTAKRLSPAPPHIGRAEADAAVGTMYQAAVRAAGLVAELTELSEPPVTAATRVVDRAAWIDANTSGMRAVLSPLTERLAAANPPSRLAASVGGRVTGTQVGAVLAFLSGKVLGQFEFFDRPGGQLLLVAPNIVGVERQLGLDPADFRLWVCLHEVTHRVQFTAVPWMRQHMHDEVRRLTEAVDTDTSAIRERISGAASELVKVVRGRDDGSGLMNILATDAQRAILDRVSAFMSLVEGHAEYVMNAVSPSVIGTQQQIEQRFAARRRGANPLDRLLRRLLGMQAKTRQYVDGSAFVRTVVGRVGVSGFNAIWSSPQTLPTKAEIADPSRWIVRVHA